MRHLGALALGALLAGCSTGGGAPVAQVSGAKAGPVGAILYRDTVTVHFSDGAMCAAPRPGTARMWAGTLAGCPHLLPYTVTLPAGRMAARRVLVKLPEGGMVVLALPSTRFGLNPPVT